MLHCYYAIMLRLFKHSKSPQQKYINVDNGLKGKKQPKVSQ